MLIGDVLLCLRTNFQLDSTADAPGMLGKRSEMGLEMGFAIFLRKSIEK